MEFSGLKKCIYPQSLEVFRSCIMVEECFLPVDVDSTFDAFSCAKSKWPDEYFGSGKSDVLSSFVAFSPTPEDSLLTPISRCPSFDRLVRIVSRLCLIESSFKMRVGRKQLMETRYFDLPSDVD